jgi:transposase
MDIKCKRCNSKEIVKNGFVRDQQRYKCKDCKCNFVLTDKRKKLENEPKKMLAIMMYGLGKCSFRMIGKILGVSNVSVLKWIRNIVNEIPEPEIQNNVTDIEIDEMWHFLKKNLKSSGLLEQSMELQRKPLAGLRESVTIKRLRDYMKNSHI